MDKNSYPKDSIIWFKTENSAKDCYSVGHIKCDNGVLSSIYEFDYIVTVNKYGRNIITNHSVSANVFTENRLANVEERKMLYSKINEYLENKAAAICNEEEDRLEVLTSVDAICKKLGITRTDIITILQNEAAIEDGDGDGEEV